MTMMVREGAFRTVWLFIDWSSPALSSTKWSKPLDGSNSCCSEVLTLRPRFIDVAARASLISSCLRRLPCRLMLFLILILPALVKLTIPVTILDAPDLIEDLNDLQCVSYTMIYYLHSSSSSSSYEITALYFYVILSYYRNNKVR